MAVIAVSYSMLDLIREAIRAHDHEVVRIPPEPSWETPPPVDLIVAKEPRVGWVKRIRGTSAFATVSLLAIKSGGERARTNLMAAGADLCLEPSSPEVVVAYVGSLLRRPRQP